MKAKVIVDADACPRSCLAILKQEQVKYQYRLLTVASYNHQINNDDHIVVDNQADAADIAIINSMQPGDLVITQDWGLAALVLAKGGLALSPAGRIYNNEQMDFMLEERSLKAKVRRAGGKTKGVSARRLEDDQRFHRSLLKLLETMMNCS
ncbi:MAG: DUF188 domain-containing protein [Firmicutes bacterium]|nr:DUF188 domain-containing protein [Bacillota bacterium]